VRYDGRCRSASKRGQTFRCSRIGLICGGTVSPTRNVSAEGVSAMHTRSSGAKSASEIAVAAPAGPAPAIRTSKSAKAQLAFTAYQDATTPAGLIGGGPPPFGALPEWGTVRTIDPTMAGTCCTPFGQAGTR